MDYWKKHLPNINQLSHYYKNQMLSYINVIANAIENGNMYRADLLNRVLESKIKYREENHANELNFK